MDLQRVHQSDDVESTYGLLAIADRIVGKKTCGAIAAQIRDDYSVACRRQQKGDIDETVNVVGPAVEKDDRRAVGEASFGVSNVRRPASTCLSAANDVFVPGLIEGTSAGFTFLVCASAELNMQSWAAATVITGGYG
jgi:hypothetical protein